MLCREMMRSSHLFMLCYGFWWWIVVTATCSTWTATTAAATVLPEEMNLAALLETTVHLRLTTSRTLPNETSVSLQQQLQVSLDPPKRWILQVDELVFSSSLESQRQRRANLTLSFRWSEPNHVDENDDDDDTVVEVQRGVATTRLVLPFDSDSSTPPARRTRTLLLVVLEEQQQQQQQLMSTTTTTTTTTNFLTQQLVQVPRIRPSRATMDGVQQQPPAVASWWKPYTRVEMHVQSSLLTAGSSSTTASLPHPPANGSHHSTTTIMDASDESATNTTVSSSSWWWWWIKQMTISLGGIALLLILRVSSSRLPPVVAEYHHHHPQRGGPQLVHHRQQQAQDREEDDDDFFYHYLHNHQEQVDDNVAQDEQPLVEQLQHHHHQVQPRDEVHHDGDDHHHHHFPYHPRAQHWGGTATMNEAGYEQQSLYENTQRRSGEHTDDNEASLHDGSYLLRQLFVMRCGNNWNKNTSNDNDNNADDAYQSDTTSTVLAEIEEEEADPSQERQRHLVLYKPPSTERLVYRPQNPAVSFAMVMDLLDASQVNSPGQVSQDLGGGSVAAAAAMNVHSEHHTAATQTSLGLAASVALPHSHVPAAAATTTTTNTPTKQLTENHSNQDFDEAAQHFFSCGSSSQENDSSSSIGGNSCLPRQLRDDSGDDYQLREGALLAGRRVDDDAFAEGVTMAIEADHHQVDGGQDRKAGSTKEMTCTPVGKSDKDEKARKAVADGTPPHPPPRRDFSDETRILDLSSTMESSLRLVDNAEPLSVLAFDPESGVCADPAAMTDLVHPPGEQPDSSFVSCGDIDAARDIRRSDKSAEVIHAENDVTDTHQLRNGGAAPDPQYHQPGSSQDPIKPAPVDHLQDTSKSLVDSEPTTAFAVVKCDQEIFVDDNDPCSSAADIRSQILEKDSHLKPRDTTPDLPLIQSGPSPDSTQPSTMDCLPDSMKPAVDLEFAVCAEPATVTDTVDPPVDRESSPLCCDDSRPRAFSSPTARFKRMRESDNSDTQSHVGDAAPDPQHHRTGSLQDPIKPAPADHQQDTSKSLVDSEPTTAFAVVKCDQEISVENNDSYSIAEDVRSQTSEKGSHLKPRDTTADVTLHQSGSYSTQPSTMDCLPDSMKPAVDSESAVCSEPTTVTDSVDSPVDRETQPLTCDDSRPNAFASSTVRCKPMKKNDNSDTQSHVGDDATDAHNNQVRSDVTGEPTERKEAAAPTADSHLLKDIPKPAALSKYKVSSVPAAAADADDTPPVGHDILSSTCDNRCTGNDEVDDDDPLDTDMSGAKLEENYDNDEAQSLARYAVAAVPHTQVRPKFAKESGEMSVADSLRSQGRTKPTDDSDHGAMTFGVHPPVARGCSSGQSLDKGPIVDDLSARESMARCSRIVESKDDWPHSEERTTASDAHGHQVRCDPSLNSSLLLLVDYDLLIDSTIPADNSESADGTVGNTRAASQERPQIDQATEEEKKAAHVAQDAPQLPLRASVKRNRESFEGTDNGSNHSPAQLANDTPFPGQTEKEGRISSIDSKERSPVRKVSRGSTRDSSSSSQSDTAPTEFREPRDCVAKTRHSCPESNVAEPFPTAQLGQEPLSPGGSTYTSTLASDSVCSEERVRETNLQRLPSAEVLRSVRSRFDRSRPHFIDTRGVSGLLLEDVTGREETNVNKDEKGAGSSCALVQDAISGNEPTKKNYQSIAKPAEEIDNARENLFAKGFIPGEPLNGGRRSLSHPDKCAMEMQPEDSGTVVDTTAQETESGARFSDLVRDGHLTEGGSKDWNDVVEFEFSSSANGKSLQVDCENLKKSTVPDHSQLSFEAEQSVSDISELDRRDGAERVFARSAAVRHAVGGDVLPDFAPSSSLLNATQTWQDTVWELDGDGSKLNPFDLGATEKSTGRRRSRHFASGQNGAASSHHGKQLTSKDVMNSLDSSRNENTARRTKAALRKTSSKPSAKAAGATRSLCSASSRIPRLGSQQIACKPKTATNSRDKKNADKLMGPAFQKANDDDAAVTARIRAADRKGDEEAARIGGSETRFSLSTGTELKQASVASNLKNDPVLLSQSLHKAIKEIGAPIWEFDLRGPGAESSSTQALRQKPTPLQTSKTLVDGTRMGKSGVVGLPEETPALARPTPDLLPVKNDATHRHEPKKKTNAPASTCKALSFLPGRSTASGHGSSRKAKGEENYTSTSKAASRSGPAQQTMASATSPPPAPVKPKRKRELEHGSSTTHLFRDSGLPMSKRTSGADRGGAKHRVVQASTQQQQQAHVDLSSPPPVQERPIDFSSPPPL